MAAAPVVFFISRIGARITLPCPLDHVPCSVTFVSVLSLTPASHSCYVLASDIHPTYRSMCALHLALFRARNKLFASATEAFRRGQGVVARDLARRGRELNVLMKEKHRQAASEIFASRNPGDQVWRVQATWACSCFFAGRPPAGRPSCRRNIRTVGISSPVRKGGSC